jgi:eukaryotic-like serine/threonine-protein kinase
LTLVPGARLGPYEIVSPLGAGGMGEVYRAKDPRLNRDVALKVLPEEFLEGEERRARFEREARLLAALNHPGIAAVYSFEEVPSSSPASSRHVLVMELVEGDGLDARIASGSVSLEESLLFARQIAEALAAAHAKGIVHRDLKPANVKVTPEGRVKLLDFGLAKTVEPRGAPDRSSSPTRSAGPTAAGTVLGTAPYMAPEQARGFDVDARVDVWALGCVLYEMLAGRRAFGGETVADTLAAILTKEPDRALLPEGTPAEVEDLVRRCLARDPADRPSAAEAAAALAAASAAPGADASPFEVAGPGARLVQLTSAEGVEEFPGFAADGGSIVFSRDDGGLRRLVRLDPSSGAEESLTPGGFDEIQPACAPDGRTVYFVRSRQAGARLEPNDIFGAYEGGDLWTVDLETRRESRLAEAAFNPAVSPDGTRLAFDASFGGPRRLWTADARARNPRQASDDASEAVAHVRPRWSPDGRRLVFQNVEKTKFDVRVADLESRSLVWVTNDLFLDLQPAWHPSGRFVVFSSQRSGGLNLWSVPVDSKGRPRGRLRQLTTGAGQDVGAAFSPDGRRLAFSVLRQNAELWRLPVDAATGRPSGAPEKVVGGTRENSRGCFSPDGALVAFSSDRAGDMNVWVADVARRAARPVTRGPGGDYQPRFSPDGSRLAFFSCREGQPDVYTVRLDGSELTRLTANGAVNVNPAWSPDGRTIAWMCDVGGRLEVWVMAADGSGGRPLTDVGVMGHFLLFTPDGRHVVFRCPCSPPRTLRVPVAGGEPEPVADVRGGAHMSFSPDASRIADVVAHKTIWVSPLAGGEPEGVFAFDDPDVRIDYPVWSPDGRSILFDRVVPRGGDVWMLQAAG